MIDPDVINAATAALPIVRERLTWSRQVLASWYDASSDRVLPDGQLREADQRSIEYYKRIVAKLYAREQELLEAICAS